MGINLQAQYQQIVMELNNLYKHQDYLQEEVFELEEELKRLGNLLEFSSELNINASNE